MLLISVIVPSFNEEKTIRLLLEAINRQNFPHDKFEVVIADGLSTDKTRQVISQFQEAHPVLAIRLVDNPKRNIPAGLNRAIEAAQGKYIVRLDAHSMPNHDYLERCLSDLEAGLGENVGGVWEIKPGLSAGGTPTWIALGIAAAASHPLGVGDAYYRFTEKAQYVDTVPFGAFEREMINRIGFFDESLLTNEDYEFNVRIRQAGGKIWLDPAIRSVYFARSTLQSLAQQYWRYGFWKGRMLKRYPKTLRWRQLIPPLFVASFIVLSILAPFTPWTAWLLFLQLGFYWIALLGTGITIAWKKMEWKFLVSFPLAIMVMHFAWGAGLIWSILSSPFSKG